MSLSDRAAQFSPFAALNGYDAAIQETARPTDVQILPDVDSIAALDAQFRCLAEYQAQQPEITAEYFVPDERKQGGAYRYVTGKIKKVDGLYKAIILTDGTWLFFDRICRIESPVLK